MSSQLARKSRLTTRRPASFTLLIILIVAAFVFGGGARDDIRSLLLLRPISAILLAAAVVYFLPAVWREHRAVLTLAGAWAGLILLHLMPLPPGVWSALPGHGVVVDLYAAAGTPLPWLPLSMAPDVTWNALFALMAPLAALILALSLERESLVKVIGVILAIGFISGVIGLLQAIHPDQTLLYFYRITNERNAVGVFANRNHQAMFLACLFPLLSAYVSLMVGKHEKLVLFTRLAMTGAALLVPLLLVTGSRAGLLVGVISLVIALAIYRRPVPVGRVVKGRGTDPRQIVIALGGIAVLAVVTVAMSRATALERLMGIQVGDDLRATVAPIALKLSGDYFPFGSGIGSFVEAFRLAEPQQLLRPTYVNHAHNDFLELLMTGGAPAMAILLAALIMFGIAFKDMFLKRAPAVAEMPSRILGKLGLALILLLALASSTDYPLRTPSLAVLFSFAIACVSVARRELALHRLSGHTRGELDLNPAGERRAQEQV